MMGELGHDTNADTRVALLLCGHFGKPRENGIKPLEPREYHVLIGWLKQRGLAPSDLFQEEGDLQTMGMPIAQERLRLLLGRGAALALAVESWTSRGLWVISQYDHAYPARFRQLGKQAPPLLYGVGDPALLGDDDLVLAIVGSRDIDAAARAFVAGVATACGRQEIRVVSGGARGVDSEALAAALAADGTAVGVLADSLARAAVARANIGPLTDGTMTLVSPYDPASGFNVGNAMGRNKYIYALADAALVVSAAAGTGGTWQGAVEALKRRVPPVFIRLEEPIPVGNLKLLEEGAVAFPDEPWEDLVGWLKEVRQVDLPEESMGQGRLW